MSAVERAEELTDSCAADHVAAAGSVGAEAGAWRRICHLEDLLEEAGAAAWLEGTQVALFRVRGQVYAIGNQDPASGANVLSRGIVGELGATLVVASPIYKQHFSLSTGRCLEEPALSVPSYAVRVDGGWISLRSPMPAVQKPPAAHRVARRRLVVVGNGMAATRTLEELLKIAPEAYDITLFGAEPHEGYNRILLSAVLAGERAAAEVVTHPLAWYAEHGIRLHRADPVVRIDRRRRVVHSRSGVAVPYDRLLLATGSKAVTLPIPGSDLPGVMRFRDLQDVEAMLAAAERARTAVVIGGGLLGLEAAHGLLERGMQVTVVHLASHLMERQLDAPAAELLQKELERRGMRFRLGARATRIEGDSAARAVELVDGRKLPAQLVVMAVGVLPNAELARSAGLRCGRGILVDDTLQSFDPSIYAVGECVEHRGRTFGLIAPVWEQARICAVHLAGHGLSAYRSGEFPSQLKVSGVELFSAGNCAGGAGTESLVLRDPLRGIYRRVVLAQGRVRGAVLYGDVRDARQYLELINSGQDVSRQRERLLFAPMPEEAATP
jgi:NAD(P)H-dependent nitrite reductase small subunit